MSMTENINTDASAKAISQSRPLVRRIMHWVRRSHLYFGLFLFPWALLYGITAFLFNHPTVLSDQPMVMFGPDTFVGTTLEHHDTPQEIATAIVAQWNREQKPSVPYQLASPEKARFSRDLAFAQTHADGRQISILVNLVHGGGTIRSQPASKNNADETPPFVETKKQKDNSATPSPPVEDKSKKSDSASSLSDQVHAAIPILLQQHGFAYGDITVTSVPDVSFLVEAGGKIWQASYNPQTGVVNGKLPSDSTPEISWRRFLTRLHVAHGYPNAINARWLWAIIVDLMSFVMVFWGVSGLFMWWQIKATRRLGLATVLFSIISALTLSVAMYWAIRG